MDFSFELIRMREAFDKNRPQGLQLPRPKWVDNDPGISQIWDDSDLLIRHGQVYYAALVQANTILFRLLPYLNCPAQVIYSTDPATTDDPSVLLRAAVSLYTLKSAEDVPDAITAPVECIRDEYDRSVFDLKSEDGLRLRMQTIMVFRRHIPGGVLRGSIFPIIACPSACSSRLILPKKYWTKEFIRYFRSR